MATHVGKWTIRFCQLIAENPEITQAQIKSRLLGEGANVKQIDNIITHRELFGERINKFPVSDSTFKLNAKGIEHSKQNPDDARTINRAKSPKPKPVLSKTAAKLNAPDPAVIPLSQLDSELDQIAHSFSDQYSQHLAKVIIDDITAKLPVLILHGLAERFGNPHSLFNDTMATIQTALPGASQLETAKALTDGVKSHLLDKHIKPGTEIEPTKIPSHSPFARSESKISNLIKIGIVGLLPIQMDMMREEFADYFDLRMPEKPLIGEKLWEKIADAKYVITLTKFVNHAHTDTTAKHPGSILVHGGISSLKMKLDEIKRQEIAAKAA